MSSLLWNKSGVETDPAVMTFLAGTDVLLDRELFPFDLRATAAHARGLGRRGWLTADEVDAIVGALDDLGRLFAAGEFVLDERFEDGHSAIESFLTDRLGAAGARVHLGRSRNDQVLVATRLYMIDALQGVQATLIESARAALERARTHEHDPMPGYTHLQRATPSSVGLWMASFAESFAESADLARLTTRWLDSSPLGTAAGYGVNLPLDREGVASELGFSRLQINPMAAQASRGKHEVQVLSVLWQALQDARRLAWDLSLFSTAEFGFVRMPEHMLTGSSIMPNKRNPDVAEVMRASCATVAGRLTEVQQILGLPSGYHRDLQLTKRALVDGVAATRQTLTLLPDILRGTTFDLERMRAAIDPGMAATDRAVELAVDGLPFREAYRQVAAELASGAGPAGRSADESRAARVSPGGCADLRLDELAARIDALATD